MSEARKAIFSPAECKITSPFHNGDIFVSSVLQGRSVSLGDKQCASMTQRQYWENDPGALGWVKGMATSSTPYFLYSPNCIWLAIQHLPLPASAAFWTENLLRAKLIRSYWKHYSFFHLCIAYWILMWLWLSTSIKIPQAYPGNKPLIQDF